jgi:hypothetical protein
LAFHSLEARGGKFSLHRLLQASIGIIQPSLAIKRPVLEADQPTASTGEVKNACSYTSFPLQNIVV